MFFVRWSPSNGRRRVPECLLRCQSGHKYPLLSTLDLTMPPSALMICWVFASRPSKRQISQCVCSLTSTKSALYFRRQEWFVVLHQRCTVLNDVRFVSSRGVQPGCGPRCPWQCRISSKNANFPVQVRHECLHSNTNRLDAPFTGDHDQVLLEWSLSQSLCVDRLCQVELPVVCDVVLQCVWCQQPRTMSKVFRSSSPPCRLWPTRLCVASM